MCYFINALSLEKSALSTKIRGFSTDKMGQNSMEELIPSPNAFKPTMIALAP